MSIKSALLVAIVAVFLFAACGQPETETAPVESAPVAEETGPDPTVVDAGHYTAEFENDRVRIVRIAYGPGEESVMHYHPQAVGVYLTDANVEMGIPDGEPMAVQAAAGKSEFYPAGQHLPKNVGEQALELVLVELKAGAAGPEIPAGQDAIAVDPEHYTTEFENEQVRILRIAYGAGDESTMHYHPDSVAVFLTDHEVEMTTPDGSASVVNASARESMFIPAGLHHPRNVSEGPLELVLVELK